MGQGTVTKRGLLVGGRCLFLVVFFSPLFSWVSSFLSCRRSLQHAVLGRLDVEWEFTWLDKHTVALCPLPMPLPPCLDVSSSASMSRFQPVKGEGLLVSQGTTEASQMGSTEGGKG